MGTSSGFDKPIDLSTFENLKVIVKLINIELTPKTLPMPVGHGTLKVESTKILLQPYCIIMMLRILLNQDFPSELDLMILVMNKATIFIQKQFSE